MTKHGEPEPMVIPFPGGVELRPNGPDVIKLSMERAEQLLAELIESMPHIPEGVRAVWQMRTTPHVLIVEYSEVRNGAIVHTYAARYMAGKYKLSESVRFAQSRDVVEQAARLWPNAKVVEKLHRDPVSLRAAEQDLENQRLLAWIEKSGLTPDQIIAKIEAGELKEIKL